LCRTGLLVNPTLAPRFPLEVLDGIGDVGRNLVKPGLLQRLIQQAAGRPDKGLALDILDIAGLFADEHERRAGAAFAEDGLRAASPELASAAARCFAPCLIQPPLACRC